jgi:PTS system mannose-specific IIA component
MKNPDGPVPEAASHVGILLLSHGPLADALRDTVEVLEPEPGEQLGALSLAWDESPETASERLRKAIAKADRGRGVVLLTDMFGGTPSNLALAFLQKGRIEIVTGVNLPMVVKARALAREGRDPAEMARTLVERGRRAIVAAGELMETEKRSA